MDEVKENLNRIEYMVEVINVLKMVMNTEYSNLYSEAVKKKYATDLIDRGKLESWHREMQLLKEMIELIETI